jgi:hypothetical protein
VRQKREPGYARAAKGSKGFFAELAGFADFTGFAETANYRPAPSDWFVVVTDIENSTQAIADGRYKDVNMVAAASIVAVLNVAGEAEIPYVFGGDGATLLAPPERIDAVRTALAQLSRLISDSFHLTLRVGVVPIRELEGKGRPVRVARFLLSAGSHMALFAGGGAELAVSLVKEPGTANRYSVADETIGYEDLDLSGLSCRWEPLPTRHGVILSLLVQALDRDPDAAGRVYRAVMDGVTEILGREPDAGNPVAEESLHLRWPPRGLGLEVRALSPGRARWRLWPKLLFETLAQWILNRFDLSAGGFDAPKYREELRLNSDYRRFDDTLRLVVDCTPDQAEAIEAFLATRHDAGAIAYGTHRTDAALMTCLVFSLERSDHLHFLDGANGGFTLAARQMKAQLAGV